MAGMRDVARQLMAMFPPQKGQLVDQMPKAVKGHADGIDRIPDSDEPKALFK